MLTGLKKKQRNATKRCMKDLAPLPLPLTVTIIRVGPSRLDGDNLQGACKYVRDEIARFVGTDDGSPLYRWYYTQIIGGYGVHIIFEQGLCPAPSVFQPSWSV